MKNYIAIIIGLGEGCDHTIGCNLDWKVLREENEDQARDEILKEYGEFRGSRDPNIDEIILYEIIPGSNVVFSNLAERSIDLYWAWQKNEDEMKEREEYERLKKKYGDG